MYQIKLENTLTHQEYLFECDDIYNGEKLYYKFNINTKELDEGEYKLTLLNDKGKIEAEDVLKIGNFNPSTLQYRSGENIYISNKYDVKIGDKNAVIDSVESVVYPDEEYDAMTSVTINAQGVYDDGYSVGNTEGYNNGYTIGKEEGFDEGYQEGVEKGYQNGFDNGVIEQKKFLTNITITENGTYTRENGYSEVVVNVPDTNGSYDEGYNDGIVEGTSNAKEIIVENAQVLDITENGTYTDTDKLIKTVNVNIVPKINMQETGLKLAYSSITEVPEWVDWSDITDMKHMFYQCSKLTNIPKINTSQVTNMYQLFYGCSSLTAIPQLNTSNVTNMGYMFEQCSKLTDIPEIDTSKTTNMTDLFYGCSKIKTIPQIDCSNVTDMGNMFASCTALESIPPLNVPKLIMASYTGLFGYSELKNLTDVGGFINLKTSLTSDSNLKKCPNLTYQSCINILNGLYDFVGNGETPTSNQGKIKVHQNFLDLVDDEISIGTNKGWTITI